MPKIVFNGVSRDATATEVADKASRDAVMTPQKVLQDKRDAKFLFKGEFCWSCYQNNILTADEAKAGARGEWAPSFANFFIGQSEATITAAEIKWADADRVFYNDPLLQQLALAHTRNDRAAATALLDTLFGLS